MHSTALSVVLLLGLLGTIQAQTSPATPGGECSSNLCDTCVQNKGCYYCPGASSPCMQLSSSSFFSGGGPTCKDLKYHWGTCNVYAYAYLIAIVVGVVLILVACCCCICCCVCVCRRRRQRIFKVEEYKVEEERALIHEQAAERKANRKARSDDIKQKWGLGRSNDQKFV